MVFGQTGISENLSSLYLVWSHSILPDQKHYIPENHMLLLHLHEYKCIYAAQI